MSSPGIPSVIDPTLPCLFLCFLDEIGYSSFSPSERIVPSAALGLMFQKLFPGAREPVPAFYYFFDNFLRDFPISFCLFLATRVRPESYLSLISAINGLFPSLCWFSVRRYVCCFRVNTESGFFQWYGSPSPKMYVQSSRSLHRNILLCVDLVSHLLPPEFRPPDLAPMITSPGSHSRSAVYFFFGLTL